MAKEKTLVCRLNKKMDKKKRSHGQKMGQTAKKRLMGWASTVQASTSRDTAG